MKSEARTCSWQASAARDMAEAIVCETVCGPDTCLALLQLAQEFSCCRLLAAAMQVPTSTG